MATNDEKVPVHTGELGVSTKVTKVTVVRLYGIPAADETYDTVLFQVVDPAHDPFEVRLSGADAQRLGHKLNTAGGGTLTGSCLLSREDVEVAIDALATRLQDSRPSLDRTNRDPHEFRQLLRKLQEAHKSDG